MHVTLISMAFIDKKVLQETDHLHWKLAKGSIEQNLKNLKSDLKPDDDEVPQQLWQLLQLGYPMPILVEIVQAMQELPWSSIGVEQGHAASSMIKKHHAEMMENQLTCRSFLYQFRPLACSKPLDLEEMERLQKQIGQILQANPFAQTGRQLFLKEAFQIAENLQPLNKRLTRQDAQHIMGTHSEQYFQLDPEVRAGYEHNFSISRRSVLPSAL